MSLFKTLLIENISDNYDRGLTDDEEKRRWTNYDRHFGHRDIFYEGDNKAIFSLEPISPQFITDICNLIGWENVANFFPEQPSLSLCLDILRETDLYQILAAIIASNPNISLIPLRPTTEFYLLVRFLQENGLQFKLPESFAEEALSNWDALDSKTGFRRLWTDKVSAPENTVLIPSGSICTTRQEAIEAAWALASLGQPFVIKPNKGSQGFGVLLLSADDFPTTYDRFVQELAITLSADEYAGPLVVEEMIQGEQSATGVSPSVEFCITQDGQIIPQYACAQLFDGQVAFSGLVITLELTNDPRIQAAFEVGRTYGKALFEQGYRGFFDMDMVFGTDGKAYVVEANLRRTGGTYLHQLGESLLGPGYDRQHYLLGEELYAPTKQAIDPQLVQMKLKHLMYQTATETGVILTNPDMLRNGELYFVVIASTFEEMTLIRNEVKKSFHELISMI
jgi:phosphoribosylglycinamide formyltransferase 2